MSRTSFLTGSLAAVAVTSALTLAAPASALADDLHCGQGAVAAVYETVIHPAVYDEVSKLSHLEWRWTRQVDTLEHQFATVMSPATFETDWSRQVPGPTELQFSRKVVDQEARAAVPGTPAVTHLETVVIQPAVIVTLWTWLQTQTGTTMLKPENWAAGNGQGAQGWEITDQFTSVVVEEAVTEEQIVVDVPEVPATPAVPEVSHLEYDWFSAAPGSEWAPTGETRAGASVTERETTAGEKPEGDGWIPVATRQLTDVVLHHVWATTATDGYSATGSSRTSTSPETTESTSATPPVGDDWSKVDGSEVEVVDREAGRVLVSPERTEDVLVSEAVSATDPCPVDPLAPANPTNPTHPSGPTTSEVAPPAAPPAAQAAAQAAAPAAAQAAPQAAAPAASSGATVLPNTGNGATVGMAATGFGAVVLGGLLVGLGRRRRTA